MHHLFSSNTFIYFPSIGHVWTFDAGKIGKSFVELATSRCCKCKLSMPERPKRGRSGPETDLYITLVILLQRSITRDSMLPVQLGPKITVRENPFVSRALMWCV
ncbi:hypothetical protein LXL04_002206 [Taraxacum kok-saghyz]